MTLHEEKKMPYPTIKSTRSGLKWQSNADTPVPPKIRVRVKVPFINPEGEPVNESSGPCFFEDDCTFDSDGFVVTPDISELPPTDGTEGRYTAHLFYQNSLGASSEFALSVFGDGFPLPASPIQTTWAQIAALIGRGIAPSPSGNLPILIRDLFSSGAANAGRRPTINRAGSVWEAGNAAFTVSGGKLSPPAGITTEGHQVIEAGVSDVSVFSVVTGYGSSTPNKAMPGLIFRYVDDNNHWLVQMDTHLGETKLFERTAGVYTERATIAAAQASGSPIPLCVTATEDVIIIDLGGQEPVSYVSSQHMTATKVGVRVGYGGGSPLGTPTFEEFTVVPAFVRLGSGPVISRVPATWESDDVAAPAIQYDSQLAKWVMLYSGFDGIKWRTGIAYADNPAGPWTKDTHNPVFEPVIGEGYIAASNGFVIAPDGTWYQVYQSAPDATAGDPAGNWQVYAAKSTNKGLAWTRLNGGAPILPLGAAGSFDEKGQHDPFLRLRDDGWFEVFFAGRNAADHFSTGKSVSHDFVSWSVTIQLSDNGRFGPGLDTNGVGVQGTDPDIYSLYLGHISGGGVRWIARADTNNGGSSFDYFGGILYHGKAGEFDSNQVFDPCLVKAGDTLYLLYAGGDTAGGTEGLNAEIGVSSLTIP
jgi:hypothetical protein